MTFLAEDRGAVARFWSAVRGHPGRVGWQEDEAALPEWSGPDGEIGTSAEGWDGEPGHQRFSFTRYRHERRQRNRMRIDVTPFDVHRATRAELEAERDRLVQLGASIETTPTEPWVPFEQFRDRDARPRGERVLPAVSGGQACSST